VVSVIGREEVADFFDRYRAAFDTLDGDAVADFWHVPCAIASSLANDAQASLTWWHEDAPMRDNMRALCAVYRHGGYARAAFELRSLTPMGPHHVFADVAWTLRRGDRSVLQAFRTGYQLMRGEHGLRVLLCIAHDEDLNAMKARAD
jgi:hypothetical protein